MWLLAFRGKSNVLVFLIINKVQTQRKEFGKSKESEIRILIGNFSPEIKNEHLHRIPTVLPLACWGPEPKAPSTAPGPARGAAAGLKPGKGRRREAPTEGGSEQGARRRGCPWGLRGGARRQTRAVGGEHGAWVRGLPAERRVRARHARLRQDPARRFLPHRAPHARADRSGRRRRPAASTPRCRRGDGRGSRPWPCPSASHPVPRTRERPRRRGRPAYSRGLGDSRRSGTW